MKNSEKAKNLGKSWSESLFKDFQEHPEYKGPNFSWDRFPEMAAKMAEANCPMYFNPKCRQMEILSLFCYEAAKNRAKELIKEYYPRESEVSL